MKTERDRSKCGCYPDLFALFVTIYFGEGRTVMRESGEPTGGVDKQRGGSGWLRVLRKVCVALLGGAIVTVGVALIVLPGPAVVVLPFGVAVLATEFAWAERLLQRIRKLVDRAMQRVKRPGRADSSPYVSGS
jgi:hypothetical protein